MAGAGFLGAVPGGWSDLAPAGSKFSAVSRRWHEVPCVAFDDARAGKGLRLYADPVQTVVAYHPARVDEAFDEVRRLTNGGLHAAGFIAYEAGLSLEPRLQKRLEPSAAQSPLLWFGLFERAHFVDASWATDIPADLGLELELGWSFDEYAAAVNDILDLIRAGDCYQINLTFPSRVIGIRDPFEAFSHLRVRQRAGWGGYLYTGRQHLLSCSPELFFATDGRLITAKPMKGTAPRSADAAEDHKLAVLLSESAKDRSENLMIVDLLRNDLARISDVGSVTVPSLFDIETYPTVHQMTSTIQTLLRQDQASLDVLRTMFPCGSVTGAPKMRAMEIIHQIERRPRGAYTGSLGFIDPNGTAAFNVVIRTVEVDSGGEAWLSLGSAIVADSNASNEWAECISKAAFLRCR